METESMYSVTMLLLLFIEIKPFSWQVTLSKKLIHLTLLFKWKFFRHRWSNQYLTAWLQQSFPRFPMALAMSLGFEFLLETSLHPLWIMIVSGVSSVSVGIT